MPETGRPQAHSRDSFIRRVFGIAISSALRHLKRKARIPVKGYTLIGIPDEHDTLGETEIFAQIEYDDGKRLCLEGEMLIGRSPIIHPGDVRIVTAVRPPEDSPLWAMKNVAIFSTRGTRPLASCLGGGGECNLWRVIATSLG